MVEQFILNENLYEIKAWNNDNIKAYFTTNQGGVSTGDFTSFNLALHVNDNPDDVTTNRHIYASKIGKNLDYFFFTNQQHTDTFYEVTKGDLQDPSFNNQPIDALYTFCDDLILNCFYADCTPVYFKSEKDNLVGIIHAGWQGTVKEITYKTLNHIINHHGIDPKNISVIVGPSISVDNFEVGDDVISQINHNLIDYHDCYTPHQNENKYHLDVKLMNKKQAKALNIKDISVSAIDTYSNDLLYSFRKNNITGRMCATIYQTNHK